MNTLLRELVCGCTSRQSARASGYMSSCRTLEFAKDVSDDSGPWVEIAGSWWSDCWDRYAYSTSVICKLHSTFGMRTAGRSVRRPCTHLPMALTAFSTSGKSGRSGGPLPMYFHVIAPPWSTTNKAGREISFFSSATPYWRMTFKPLSSSSGKPIDSLLASSFDLSAGSTLMATIDAPSS